MRKVFGCMVVAAVCFVGLVTAMGGNILLYLNIPSLLIVLVIPILYQNMLFGFSGFVTAFSALFQENVSAEDLAKALAFFSSFGRSIWLFAAMAALLGFTGVLAGPDTSPDLGFHLALTLVPLLYAVLLHLAFICPFTARLRLRMAENVSK